MTLLCDFFLFTLNISLSGSILCFIYRLAILHNKKEYKVYNYWKSIIYIRKLIVTKILLFSLIKKTILKKKYLKDNIKNPVFKNLLLFSIKIILRNQ